MTRSSPRSSRLPRSEHSRGPESASKRRSPAPRCDVISRGYRPVLIQLPFVASSTRRHHRPAARVIEMAARRDSGSASLRVRRFSELVLVAASLAVFAHHASPALGTPMIDSAAHTCLAVGAHGIDAAGSAVALPAATAFFATATPLAVSTTLLTPRRLLATRAGPDELLLPLRC